MKFKNEYDEYVYQEAEDWSGESESPTGSFSPLDLHIEPDGDEILNHYDSPWLLIHESNEGFVTVITSGSREERDERVKSLEQAYSLWSSGITVEQAVEALAAYRQCALWSSVNEDGEPLDGLGLSLSGAAHKRTKDDVLEFITSDIEHLRPYMETAKVSWGQVGHDFWLTRNRHGAGFWDRGVAGPAVDALVASSHAWGECTMYVGDSGDVEVA